jgi:hypothetical protein
LTSLVKKIDAATQKHNKDANLCSFVVFMNDDEGLDKKLKEVAEKEGIKKTILTIDNPSGPTAYKIAKDADVTVIMYNKHTVHANHAFKKGELNEKTIDAVVADIKKIIPEK